VAFDEHAAKTKVGGKEVAVFAASFCRNEGHEGAEIVHEGRVCLRDSLLDFFPVNRTVPRRVGRGKPVYLSQALLRGLGAGNVLVRIPGGAGETQQPREHVAHLPLVNSPAQPAFHPLGIYRVPRANLCNIHEAVAGYVLQLAWDLRGDTPKPRICMAARQAREQKGSWRDGGKSGRVWVVSFPLGRQLGIECFLRGVLRCNFGGGRVVCLWPREAQPDDIICQ